MKHGIYTAILIAGLSLPLPAAGQPAHETATPLEIVRSIRDVQDRIALGQANEISASKALILEAARLLAAQDAKVWREPGNTKAALVFVMSGGDPQILRSILGAGKITGVDESVVKGVLAYAEGRDDDARSLLGEVDARALDIVIAAHVALIQGVIFAEKDSARARVFFDRARLLAPESSIEEVALRREVPMLVAKGELEASEYLSSRYFRRYGRSIYARSFRRQFARDVARRPEASDAKVHARLADVLEDAALPDRRELYLALAKQSVIKGNVGLARFAAAHAAQLSSEGSLESVRSKVYEAAALVVTDDYAEAVDTLERVDRAALVKRDAELFDAASSVAAEVQRWPDGSGVPDASPVNYMVEKPRDTSTRDLVNRARELMTRVDMMSGASK